jgi:hypothetical protein
MSQDRSFLDTDVHDVLSKLTLEEKTKLLSAPDWWNTHPIPRLGIPAVRMSDGPNVRSLPRSCDSCIHETRFVGNTRIFALYPDTCSVLACSWQPWLYWLIANSAPLY